MNHHRSGASISLASAVHLARDFGNETLVNPKESEKSIAFQRDVLSLLRGHEIIAADLERLVYGDGVWTLLQYLRMNPEMPWNALILLVGWNSRYKTTGYDFIAVWAENEEFRTGS